MSDIIHIKDKDAARRRRGGHKLTNTSETEPLVYLDFDTKNGINVCFYPDSGKIGVRGKEVNRLHKLGSRVDYYLDE